MLKKQEREISQKLFSGEKKTIEIIESKKLSQEEILKIKVIKNKKKFF